jgi:hypothetical protein
VIYISIDLHIDFLIHSNTLHDGKRKSFSFKIESLPQVVCTFWKKMLLLHLLLIMHHLYGTSACCV